MTNIKQFFKQSNKKAILSRAVYLAMPISMIT
jgi:hypothetical protein